MDLRRILFGLGLVAVLLLAACADPLAEGNDSPQAPRPSHRQRIDVYEALVRHLADPRGPKPIYVVSDLCFELMRGEQRCPDHLSRDEEQELGARLRDLGDIVFRRDDEPGPSPEESFQQILLSPIVDKPDGLRVEGGVVCGGLCGSGSVYVLEETEDGYEVTGTDDTYGSWIS
jgi:hypothetical protein